MQFLKKRVKQQLSYSAVISFSFFILLLIIYYYFWRGDNKKINKKILVQTNR